MTWKHSPARKDLRVKSYLAWDHFVRADIDGALAEIHSHATLMAQEMKEWYWNARSAKKRYSLFLKGVSVLLFAGGAILPYLSSVFASDHSRLTATQIGVVALVVAGLLQALDRVLGLSSGWVRYVTTVLTMESSCRVFELNWKSHLLKCRGVLTEEDKHILFELAKRFEEELLALQRAETDKWVVEFNSSQALLDGLIKSKLEAGRQSDDAGRAGQDAPGMPEREGGIEVALLYEGPPRTLDIGLDDEALFSYTGTHWCKLKLAPGLHLVHLQTVTDPPLSIQRAVEVPAGGVGKLEIKL